MCHKTTENKSHDEDDYNIFCECACFIILLTNTCSISFEATQVRETSLLFEATYFLPSLKIGDNFAFSKSVETLFFYSEREHALASI